MILLDTHAFVWLASAPEQLSKPAREAIQANLGELKVSLVTSWEIALLCRKERLHLPVDAGDFIEKAMEQHGIEELPLTRAIILRAVALEAHHNDPFDRVLVAEACAANCPIISKDRRFPAYGVPVIW